MTKYIIKKYLFFLASVADLYAIWQIISLPAFADGLWCWIMASIVFSAFAVIYFNSRSNGGNKGPKPPGSESGQVINIYDSIIVDSNISVSQAL